MQLCHIHILLSAVFHKADRTYHNIIVFSDNIDALAVTRFLDYFFRARQRFNHPCFVTPDTCLLQQFKVVIFQISVGHIKVGKVGAHEAGRFVRTRNTLNLFERRQIEPLVVIFFSIIIIIRQEACITHICRRFEEHDLILILAIIFTIGFDITHTLFTAFVNERHLHLLLNCLTVITCINLFHDRPCFWIICIRRHPRQHHRCHCH